MNKICFRSFLVVLALILAGGGLCHGNPANSPAVGKIKVALLPQAGALRIEHDGRVLPVALTCPQFIIENNNVGSGHAPLSVKGEIERGPLTVDFAPLALDDGARLEVKLTLDWSAQESILRKQAHFRLTQAAAPRLLKEIVLERLATKGRNVWMPVNGGQSYPAFLDGFFSGIEFPMATTRVEAGDLLVAHQPGWRLKPGVWYDSRKAVFGAAQPGGERETFERYVAAHHPPVKDFRTSYNYWYSLQSYCSIKEAGRYAFAESEVLNITKAFEENLFKPYHVNFDTMIVEFGWSKPDSLWELDRKVFPNGLTDFRQTAARINSGLGMWISPSSCYSDVQNYDWAWKHGYEVITTPPFATGPLHPACLGGPRYRQRFKDCLVEMVAREGLRHFKLDGINFNECMETGHGHEPGISKEAVAEGAIEAFEAAHRAAPGVWLETTCMGWNPSPWWLFYADSVVGNYGDDCVFGRAPSPVYRESFTSSRDFYNLQGADRLPIPIAFQEVMGLNHITDEDFMNDGVTCVMRGHMFLPVYLNPLDMNNLRWKNLAGLLKWAHANAPVIMQTKPLLPVAWQKAGTPLMTGQAEMPLEPYGYSHWNGERGLVELRNPWIQPQSYALKLDKKAGVPEGIKGLSAVSLYPEPRVYGHDLAYDDTLNVPLAPYETVVLSFEHKQPQAQLPAVAAVTSGHIKLGAISHELKKIDLKGTETLTGDRIERLGLGPGWTGRLEKNTFVHHLKLEADIPKISTPQVQLVVYLEGGTRQPPKYAYKVADLGMGFTLSPHPSKTLSTIYNASHIYGPHWIFLTSPLPLELGTTHISLELLGGDDCTKISAWVWGTKRGGQSSDYPNALPSPEVLSVDGAELVNIKLQ